MATSAPIYPSPAPIPIDLFVSKKHEGLSRGEIGFADPLGNLVFRVTKNSSSHNWVVFDRLGVLLLSIYRQHNGCWHVFKGGNVVEKEMIFGVERTLNKFFKPELEACLVKENSGESTSNFKVKGFPFQRSCVIYGGNTIVAETSLMHNLHQIFVGRSIFRLTIFPGSIDHALVVALVVIFLYG